MKLTMDINGGTWEDGLGEQKILAPRFHYETQRTGYTNTRQVTLTFLVVDPSPATSRLETDDDYIKYAGEMRSPDL